MSNQNRFLLPHQPTSTGNHSTFNSTSKLDSSSSAVSEQENENHLSVDDNFDSYWEEEARNPHRNRIRIGRQYQATVPQLLKPGEKDQRRLEELETLSFCPKSSAKVSNAELDHYFTVAKSLNLFASLVETRSLLGRDVTIADLNRIRHKEGLSLASVIQPNRHNNNTTTISPQSSQQASVSVTSSNEQKSPHKSPTSANDNLGSSSTAEASSHQDSSSQESYTPNLALMRALSHFISLHHPCHHDTDCKKLMKDIPLEDEQEPVVSIKSGNLRGQSSSTSPSKESKSSRSRSSAKQQVAVVSKSDEPEAKDVVLSEQDQASSDNQAVLFYDWTREEVNLFSKAIEVCGKNFGSIKKEFLPSKSVRSIVEYYYIGSRETSDGKKRLNHGVDSTDGCSSYEKNHANNNGGGSGGSSSSGGHTSPNSKSASASNSDNNTTSGPTSNSDNASNNNSSKSMPDTVNDVEKPTYITSKSTNKLNISLKQSKIEPPENKQKSKNIDARMSIYNFDDETREENNPIIDCPCPGAEVKPLKAKPILPNTPAGSEAGNSNVGSLKFFMDGQLVLKLNACQEQQKCHWVQSGDKIPSTNQRNKRYSKRSNDRLTDSTSLNGSQTNSINEDELKTGDLTADDEDSKESANSFTNVVTPRQNSVSASPSPKRSRTKNDSTPSPNQAQMSSPIDYNRLAVTNMKERNDSNLNVSNNNNNIMNNPIMNPWLQANNFAMAAGLFSLFPQAANNLVANQIPNPVPNMVNMASRPMDLSVEHTHSQKPLPTAKSTSRSKSKQKHS